VIVTLGGHVSILSEFSCLFGFSLSQFNLFLLLHLIHFLMSELAQVADNTLSVSEHSMVLEMVVKEA
jgi:hypothetical protein